ncbi:UNVERIFIED_CONTAM: hypothetical protein FKN15_023833 [Acipenser sinensis]
MGRKSCKKQQKRRQQLQLPPGDVGPSYVVDEWCPGCEEFGHTVAICPTQYQEEEVEPEPQEEDGWEALLRSMGVQYCCCICGELGHFPANCPLPPVRDLRYPPTPAEGEFLLVPPPPAEGACLLVPPPSPPPAEGACLRVSRLQQEGEEPLPPSPRSRPSPSTLSPPARGEEQELPLPPPPPVEELGYISSTHGKQIVAMDKLIYGKYALRRKILALFEASTKLICFRLLITTTK